MSSKEHFVKRSENPARMVVIATYNERENISALIDDILGLTPKFRILVVDDTSPDGTGEVVSRWAGKDARVSLLSRPVREGYGPAALAGFKEALRRGADRIFTMDADHSHDPRSLTELDRTLDKHDLVIGSRYRDGIRIMNWSPARLALSLGANAYLRFILRLPYADCTSGFRGYLAPALESALRSPVRSSGYAFLVEILYRCHRTGFSIGEITIIYTERRAGRSKLSRSSILEAVYRPWLLLAGGKAMNRERKR